MPRILYAICEIPLPRLWVGEGGRDRERWRERGGDTGIDGAREREWKVGREGMGEMKREGKTERERKRESEIKSVCTCTCNQETKYTHTRKKQ